MSRLILPGDRPARRPVQVVVPHDGDRRATGFCGVCDVPFYSERDMRGHLNGGAHKDRVEMARREREAQKDRLAIFHTSADPEVEAHLKVVGQRMIREGRMVVKPSERAGF